MNRRLKFFLLTPIILLAYVFLVGLCLCDVFIYGWKGAMETWRWNS